MGACRCPPDLEEALGSLEWIYRRLLYKLPEVAAENRGQILFESHPQPSPASVVQCWESKPGLGRAGPALFQLVCFPSPARDKVLIIQCLTGLELAGTQSCCFCFSSAGIIGGVSPCASSWLDDPSLDPRTFEKMLDAVVHICNLNTPKAEWELRDRRISDRELEYRV